MELQQKDQMGESESLTEEQKERLKSYAEELTTDPHEREIVFSALTSDAMKELTEKLDKARPQSEAWTQTLCSIPPQDNGENVQFADRNRCTCGTSLELWKRGCPECRERHIHIIEWIEAYDCAKASDAA